MSDKQSKEHSKSEPDNWVSLQSLFLRTKGKQPDEEGKVPLDNWDVLQSLFYVNQDESGKSPNQSNPTTEEILEFKKEVDKKINELNIRHGELTQKLDNKYKEVSDKLDQVYEDIKRRIDARDTKLKTEINNNIDEIYNGLKKLIDVHYAQIESEIDKKSNQISSKIDQGDNQVKQELSNNFKQLKEAVLIPHTKYLNILEYLKNRNIQAVLATSILIPSAAWWWVNSQKPIFSDIKNHWAEEFIQELGKKGIIKGFRDRTFRPDSQLTRAQYAAILTKAFNLPPSRNIKNFHDIKSNFWAYDAIQRNYNYQFLKGFPNNTFRPKDKVQRVQVIAALVNGSALSQVNNSQVLLLYDDSTSIPSWSKAAVITATANELVVNYPDIKQFNPTQSATRAEVVVMIYQSMVKAKKIPPIKSKYIVSTGVE